MFSKINPARSLAAVCTLAALATTAGCAPMGHGGMMGMAHGMSTADMAAHAFASASDLGEIETSMLALQRSQNPQVRTFAQMMVNTHTPALQSRDMRMAQMGMGMQHGMMGNRGNMGGGNRGNMGGNRGNNASGNNTTGGNMSGGMNMGSGTMDEGMMTRMRGMLMEHPTSRPLAEANMRTLQALQGHSGGTFDRAYMDAQVSAHRYTLEQMNRMIGMTGNMMLSPEVLGMMEAMRASVTGHLATAQQLQGMMGGAMSPGM